MVPLLYLFNYSVAVCGKQHSIAQRNNPVMANTLYPTLKNLYVIHLVLLNGSMTTTYLVYFPSLRRGGSRLVPC
jgi:hypothetical protein